MALKTKLYEMSVSSYKKKLSKEVKEIREEVDKLVPLSNEQLKEVYENLQNNTNQKEVRKISFAIGTLLVERLLGLSLFDVQIQGALVLAENKIAEMKTGEGKTVTSVLPAIYKCALSQKVHIVTVNEYLAERDKTELEPVYKALGLTVSLNLNGQARSVKQQNYLANIMYSTATEMGFDYLSDNMVVELKDKVQQGVYDYALIDEVDLVLIDEARTPLIIGRPGDLNQLHVQKAQLFVDKLTKEDCLVDKEHRTVVLTRSGSEKFTQEYKDEPYSSESYYTYHLVHQALIANFIYENEVDYLVAVENGDKVVNIIDTFTGRVATGRRFSNGLHQALEAKHLRDGVKIKEENLTVATITLQNFFRKYSELAGMTGTAQEERDEMYEIYGLKVVPIDTNKPVIRKDNSIQVFNTKKEKWNAVVDLILSHHEAHRPILVGTTSVEDSELLSDRLREKRLAHRVLNAKQDAEEAEIISRAGEKGSITVATNMAGRGTDIKVDSDTELVVILTELNESSRIDNQLKGRTSRQGAPGTTETYISLEDTIFVKTGFTEKLQKINFKENNSKMFYRIIENVQKELESQSFNARKNAVEYDEIIKKQRDLFYATRDLIMEKESDIHDLFLEFSDEETKQKIFSLTEETDKQNMLMKDILLYVMDSQWIHHIDNLSNLRTGITWRGQNGENPVIVYQNISLELFRNFVDSIKGKVSEVVSKIKTQYDVERENAYNERLA